jgi:hypothetical protein
VGFDVTDPLLIRFSAFVIYWRKKKCEYNETVTSAIPRLQESIGFSKKGGAVQYSHRVGIPMKLVRLI